MGGEDTTCLISLSKYLAPVLMSPNHGHLIRTLWYVQRGIVMTLLNNFTRLAVRWVGAYILKPYDYGTISPTHHTDCCGDKETFEHYEC